MRGLCGAVVVAMVAAMAASCGGGDSTSPGGGGGPVNTCTSTSSNVSVQNNSFSPQCTTVPVGTTITWTWTQNATNTHNVRFTNLTGVDSGIQGPGFQFTHQFNSAGTFNYMCDVHGAAMSGQIRVQ